MDLHDEQWKLLHPFLADWKKKGAPGRPRQDPRDPERNLLGAAHRRTGAPWNDLPPRYPPYQTCHPCFQEGAQTGLLEAILREVARDLRERGGIEVIEAFIDGCFAGANKGGAASNRRSGESD